MSIEELAPGPNQRQKGPRHGIPVMDDPSNDNRSQIHEHQPRPKPANPDH